MLKDSEVIFCKHIINLLLHCHMFIDENITIVYPSLININFFVYI